MTKRIAGLISGVALAALGTGSVAALAGAADVAAVGPGPVHRTQTGIVDPPGRWPLAAQAGIDTARAPAAFTLRRGSATIGLEAGASIRVAEGNGQRCMLYPTVADTCHTLAQIERGLAWSVANDCSAGGDRYMLISQMVPSAVRFASIESSDRTKRTIPVSHGMFAYETMAPTRAADPTPMSIAWIDREGRAISAMPFPLSSGQLCPG